ncbi:MAG: hypothetical protein EA398_14130 [Deltaproteobacteria bacterium]|nr:MAG: hypothetical protein EA398_14130 [Deltaproteobacteria bacterium]
MNATTHYRLQFDEEAVRRPHRADTGHPAQGFPTRLMRAEKLHDARIVHWTPGRRQHRRGPSLQSSDLGNLLSLLLKSFRSAVDRGDTERPGDRWSAIWPLIQLLVPPDEAIDAPATPVASHGETEHPRLILVTQPTTQGTIVLDCAQRYWTATGDPLGALFILKDMPEDGLAGTVAKPFTALAQEVADEMEREQLWERVYPPELPITERWKEMAGTHAQGRVLPAMLVDADEERCLLRVGEWLEDAGPASFEVVVQGDERNRLRHFPAGAFIVVTFDENDVLVSARAQECPPSSPSPVDLLKELVRRWNCLTQSP